jgi:hypothetical protein
MANPFQTKNSESPHRIHNSLFFMLFVLLISKNSLAQPHFPYNGVRDQRPATWYLSGATIIKSAGDTLRDGVVLIRNGRI